MGVVRVRARDRHELDAYVARLVGPSRGAVVVGQEMYGVNDYIRGVCDWLAFEGYAAVAPALYDRRERGLTFPYDAAGHAAGQRLYRSMPLEPATGDLEAARSVVADAGATAVLGFCWGGSLAWRSACRTDWAAAVVYYGPLMLESSDAGPRCPVLAHVGSEDPAFPRDRLDAFGVGHREVDLHVYDGAPHGFDNPGRPERYHVEAHRLARQRTLAFLRQHLG